MSDGGVPVWQQFVGQLPVGMKVNHEDLFSKAKLFGLAKLHKKRVEWLTAAAPVLRAVLEPDECVHVVSRAIVNHGVEQVTIGWMAMMVNHTILVATDRRILFIHCDGKYTKPRLYVNQLPRQAIKKIRGSFGSTQLNLGKGGRNVSYLPKADRVTLQRLFPKNSEARGGVQQLCPSCFQVSDQWAPQCGRCHVEFKSAKTAMLRSLLLPGLGDWYLGHRPMAAIEMLGAFIVWAFCAMLVFGPKADEGSFILAAVLIVFSNGMDSLVTGFQAKKGQMSSDEELPSRITGPRALQPAVGLRPAG
jgi:hypothetical protein